MRIKSYNIQDIGFRGGMGLYENIELDCTFSFNNIHQANDFMLRCQNDMDRALDQMIKVDTVSHTLTCPECFKTTRILNRSTVTNIGSGKDILGMCCDCDHIFKADFLNVKD